MGPPDNQTYFFTTNVEITNTSKPELVVPNQRKRIDQQRDNLVLLADVRRKRERRRQR